MDKKLTLSLNESVIEMAKGYAKQSNTSLSKLIESYLASLTQQKENRSKITPLVKSLSGVISIDNDFDVKDEYAKKKNKKYK